MGIIKKLHPHEAHKIAAGEVIERPVHALKELIENSIDAHADRIDIIAEEGGKKLLSITDTGCGIAPEDLPLAIARHATSKICSIDDLTKLDTHGFRGEALASIAAVSKLTVMSRQAGSSEGAMIWAEGEYVSEILPQATPIGTTIRVEKIFEQIPVRRAFLKSAESELRLLTQLIIPYALLHPGISFSFTHNGKTIFEYPRVGTIAERYAQVMGSSVAQAGIPINRTMGDTKITGYCIRPTQKRRDRNSIIVAVNNRPVKSSRLIGAIARGYSAVLEQGHFPIAFIHLHVPPNTIDINVHPRKEDILFLDARGIEESILYTIRALFAAERTAAARPWAEVSYQAPSIQDQNIKPAGTFSSIDTPPPFLYRAEEYPSYGPMISKSTNHDRKEQNASLIEIPDYRIMGQYAATYIMLEGRDGLILIDQHAAHERILYEKFRNRQEDMAPTVLLFPEQLSLSPHEIALVWSYQEIFERVGITLDQMGPQNLIARTTPVMYKGRVQDIVIDLLDKLKTERTAPELLKETLLERVCAMMACKAAVKAGDQLSVSEMHTLIETLYKTENFETCPHGRPTQWNIDLADIERAFKRR